MKQGIFEVVLNQPIAKDQFRMVLKGDITGITAPGQFVNITVPEHYLRRPISVCDLQADTLTIIYKVVGQGTAKMAAMQAGQQLDLLTGLGNGFSLVGAKRPLLAGGGVGVPPLYYLAKKLIEAGAKPVAALGFADAQNAILVQELEALGVETHVATVDGSMGTKGFVTHLLPDCGEFDFVYSCGPEVMLKAVYDATNVSGQYSFEERMGCGFGACMGCSCKTKYGAKRICKDGPVLTKEEIIW